jgi:hypothetical protein
VLEDVAGPGIRGDEVESSASRDVERIRTPRGNTALKPLETWRSPSEIRWQKTKRVEAERGASIAEGTAHMFLLSWMPCARRVAVHFIKDKRNHRSLV